MAQKLQVLLTCDLDEGDVEAVETVTFGYDGTNYAFELCAEHLEEFNKVIHTYIGSARRAEGGRRSAASVARSATKSENPGAIREWARGAGYEVSDRGRIPAEIREAYETAQKAARR